MNDVWRTLTKLGLLLLPCLVLAQPAPPQPSAVKQATNLEAILLDAASSEVDYKTNTVLFRDLSIVQGQTRVTAERARSTGLDFDDATWVLSGRVRIAVEGGELQAETANVTFKDNRIVQARIEGAPARFSQILNRGGTARGESEQIIYEIDRQTVTLLNKSWLTDGRNEIRGEQLVYSLQEQRVAAGTQTGSRERVQIIIRPTPREDKTEDTNPSPVSPPEGKP